MPPAVLLWDFGDTLVDERWMQRAPQGCDEWPERYVELMRTHGDAWDDGRIGCTEVFALLSERTGLAPDAVEAHARECCARLSFNAAAWRIARERRLPQAIVTVNPDLFEAFVVPAHRLDDVFDAIVTSNAERTTDKNLLCDIARSRLGHDRDRTSALLIDNRRDLVESWRRVGGSAYRFETDAQFGSDVDLLLR